MKKLILFLSVFFLLAGCQYFESDESGQLTDSTTDTTGIETDTEIKTEPETCTDIEPEIEPESETEIEDTTETTDTGTNTETEDTTETDPALLPPVIIPPVIVTQVKKVYLSGLSNLGIKQSGHINKNFSTTCLSITEPAEPSGDLITVDSEGNLLTVGQDGGNGLTVSEIITIKNSSDMVLIYEDSSSDRVAYIIDHNNDAHQLNSIPIDQDGLRSTTKISYYNGAYFFKNEVNDMIKAVLDVSGDVSEHVLFNGLIYFELDTNGNFMVATNENIYVGYSDYLESGHIWTLDNTGSSLYFGGFDAREQKLFFPNDSIYAGILAGGWVYFDNKWNTYMDLYLNPDCMNDQVFCRPEKQFSTRGVPKHDRADCSQEFIQSENWLLCNETIFAAGSINDGFISHDLGFAGVTDIRTAKKAVNKDYLYYGDSASKLIRIDLFNESVKILTVDYLAESLSVSFDNEVLLSGHDQHGIPALIKITSDLNVFEVDLQGDTVRQITVIK